MKFTLGEETQQGIVEYEAKGGTPEQAQAVLESLLELSVKMFRKGDIKTIQQADKMELVCQLKKGSRRLTLT